MNQEQIEKEISESEYLSQLPPKWHGFSLRQDMRLFEDTYDLFTYYNDETHRSTTIYYHDETKEYKVKVKIGKNEFCRMECIAASIEEFEIQLQSFLEKIMLEIKEFDESTLSSLLLEKGIKEWDASNLLPEKIASFSLFISPQEPLRITNGSFILIDYEDFNSDANFVIYYNIFRDEFFSESHLGGETEQNYNFDSASIEELSDIICKELQPFLENLTQRLAK